MTKPKVSITSFSGMGDGGIFRLESMAPDKKNGSSILVPKYRPYVVASTDSSTVSTNPISSMTKGLFSVDSYAGNGVLAIDSGGKIYSVNPQADNYTTGQIHQVPIDSSTTPDLSSLSAYPGIFSMKSGNVLYSTVNTLGIGYLFYADTGSSTTKLQAKFNNYTGARLNFVTAGLGTTVGKNKVYNLTKDEEHTITSITTTSDTNDTLNFSAGTAPSTGDVCIAFVDGKFDLGTDGTSGETDVDFVGQTDSYLWPRQMAQYGDLVYILNGGKLAMLNSDEATFTNNAKLLPTTYQAKCLSVNQSQIAVGCDVFGKGAVCIWDGSSSGWNYILEFDSQISGITAYKTGWLVLSGNSIFYTNGSSSEFVTYIPDRDFSTYPTRYFDAFKVIDNKILVGTDTTNYDASGLWVYDFKTGWSYVPGSLTQNKADYKAIATSILGTSSTGTSAIMTAFNDASISHSSITNIAETYPRRYGATFYIKLPYKLKLSRIELSLAASDFRTQRNVSTPVTVNWGTSSYKSEKVVSLTESGSTTTDVKLVAESYDLFNGQMIRISNDFNNVSNGERRYIESFTGTYPNVVATLDSALSAVPSDSDVTLYGLRKSETKNITVQNIPDNLYFDLEGFHDDNLYFEVYFEPGTTGGYFDLNGINIY